jgi:hypothetical protein
MGVTYTDLKKSNIIVHNKQLVLIDYGSFGVNQTKEGYATYPPLSCPSGLNVHCTEPNLVEIIGNFFATLYVPECEQFLRYQAKDISSGRQMIYGKLDNSLTSVLNFCWYSKRKTFQGLFQIINGMFSYI